VAKKILLTFAIALAGVNGVLAATFVVPDDRSFVQRAPVVVVATALATRVEQTDERSVRTIFTIGIDEVIKGRLLDTTIDVVEPGGSAGDRTVVIPGVPHLEAGERYLLFLTKSDANWHVLDLVLGKFHFTSDLLGRDVLVRDETELRDPNGSLHAEERRAAEPFLRFVRAVAAGGPARDDYHIDAQPLVSDSVPRTLRPVASAAVAAAFTATSYTFTVSGSRGARWNVFPSAVSFTTVGSEPGAPGGGTTAVNAAFAAWNGDPNSNVNYVYAGADSGAHTSGLSSPDGANTVAFERNLSAWGIAPFQCSSNSYSGTLGIGGVTSASGTHTGPNGEVFSTTLEGDVEMNQGIANCTLLFNNGDFNSAVTHEVGHTLGFRHSDQTRADDPSMACSSDPTLECSSQAIMRSFVSTGLNAALQAWDQHAVSAVYPGASQQPTPPAAPTGVNAKATTSTQVTVTWNAVANATSYQIFRRGPGSGLTQVGTSTTTTFVDTTAAPTTSYIYVVRSVNSGGASADSSGDLATTYFFTDDPLSAGVHIKAVHMNELRVAVNAVRALAGYGGYPYTDSVAPGIRIKAIHITELRSALDQALAALGGAIGGYTDQAGIAGLPIRAIHFQEIRNRVK
jgi:hypothetical protein